MVKNSDSKAVVTENPKPNLAIALVVLECHPYGGQDQYVFELAEHFATAGHEVHLYCHILRGQFSAPVTVHYVPTWGRLMLLRFVSFFICASWQIWWSAERYNIVHATGGNVWGANVVTAHYCHPVAHRITHNAAITGGVPLPFWRRIYDYLTFIIADGLDRLVYQLRPQTTIIAVSQATKNDLQQAYYLPDKQLTVIHNGVNLARFSRNAQLNWRAQIRANYQLDDQTPMLLFVGAFARKGLGVLLDAITQLPTTSLVKLWVVGSGPQPFWQQRAAERGIAAQVIWVGQTMEVEKFYAAADIFVFPTLYEPFGLVIAEAMASGLPVITSRHAGAAELITHQCEGWLLDDPQDSAALAKAIQTLLSNVAATRLMGEQARDKINNYHWNTVAEQTLSVYYQQLDQQKYSASCLNTLKNPSVTHQSTEDRSQGC